MSDEETKIPHIYIMQVSGGSAGHDYRVYTINDDNGAQIGWIVVANTDAPYHGNPAFTEHTEYWYLSEDITTYSAFTVKIDSEGSWPSTWPLPTTATYAWTAPNTNVRYTWRTNASPSATAWFSPSTSGGPNHWGWTMPDASGDGQVAWWATAEGPYFDGRVGDTWPYRSESAPTGLTMYSHDDEIPR